MSTQAGSADYSPGFGRSLPRTVANADRGGAASVAARIVVMKNKKAAPGSTRSKSRKASSRVSAAQWEAAAAVAATGRRAQRQAIGQASVAKVARRQLQKTRARVIQAHVSARGRRQQARRDSR